MNKVRGKEMLETMRRVKKEIKFLEEFAPFEQRQYVLPIVRERIRHCGRSTRAYFTRKVAEYITQRDWGEQDVKLAFVAELSACITYLENQIVDQKKGVNTPEKVNQNLISAQILKGFLRHYVSENFGDDVSMIIEKMDKVAFLFSQGEFVEKRFLNYEMLVSNIKNGKQKRGTASIPRKLNNQVKPKQFMKIWEEFVKNHSIGIVPDDFLRNYFRRTFLINTSLYEELTYILLHLHQKDFREYPSLREFARGYGMGQQMTNDIIDFVPVNWIEEAKKEAKHNTYYFSGKFTEDNFADIRNNLFTLPMILYMSAPNLNGSVITQSLKKGEFSSFSNKDQQEVIFADRDFVNSLNLARDFIRRFGGKFSSLLEEKPVGTEELKDLMSLSKTNVYFDILDS